MSSESSPDRPLGGIVHSYLGYDPKRFPPPSAPGGDDIANSAFDHLLHYGSQRPLTDAELAEAVRIDPSQIDGFGPSIEALIAMLEERRRRILETFEVDSARRDAYDAFVDASSEIEPTSPQMQDRIDRVMRLQSIPELERLWYRVEQQDGPLAAQLMGLIGTLATRLEVDQVGNRHAFTGKTPTTPEEAIDIGEELDAIEDLIRQLEEAKKNAKIALIDMDALRQFVDDADLDELREMQDRISELIREQAEQAGLVEGPEGYQLGPKALRTVQGSLLDEIFSELDASRSGRHTGPIVGEGAVEMERTRPYDFGDSAAHINIPQTLTNAAIRSAGRAEAFSIGSEDIDIHQTRNNPKAASAVIMDMSGSMRHGGQYVACKKMALALEGLVRREYPGDRLHFMEMYSVARVVPRGDLMNLLPKPVTINDPVVRLRADMSDPDITEQDLPPHFTNIQHALRLARRLLANADTPNRQVVLITDGLPTAHFEDDDLFLLYPPDPRTEAATMREAALLGREGGVLNVFLVPSWSQNEEDVRFAHRLAESTAGRVIFTGGEDLDRFVIWDYLSKRRQVIAR